MWKMSHKVTNLWKKVTNLCNKAQKQFMKKVTKNHKLVGEKVEKSQKLVKKSEQSSAQKWQTGDKCQKLV